MMRAVFKNDDLNSTFINNGFVKVKLLSKEEVQHIQEDIRKYYLDKTALTETLNISLWNDNIELKVFADSLIKSFLADKLQEILQDYEPIWGDILIKKPSLIQSFGLHQDWTFVDEDQACSVNVWCALQDVNFWNGSLQVVPKSHLLLDKVRGLNIVPSYHLIGEQIQKKYAANLEVKAGEAILFSHALLHASSPNRTFKNRTCIGLNLKPANMPVYHYILDQETNNIRKYIVDKDYFIHLGNKVNFAASLKNGFTGLEVDGILSDEFGYKETSLSFSEFEKKYNQPETILG